MIERAAKADGRSIRKLAANAGISDGRWRQITKGWQTGHGGGRVPVRPPDETLARMAWVLGLSPDSLVEVLRFDAASLLRDYVEKYGHGKHAAFSPFVAQVQVTSAVAQAVASLPSSRSHPDEIDLIYASNMSAREKLLRIRQVLELRAQAELEEAQERKKAPAPSAEAVEDDAPSEAQPS